MLPNLATGRVRAAVKVISSDDLIENGGSFRLQGRVAFRVNNLTGQTSLPASHQAMAVYPITQADVDSGRFVLAGGGPAVSVVDIDSEGISRPVMGGAAVPVYVVEGSSL